MHRRFTFALYHLRWCRLADNTLDKLADDLEARMNSVSTDVSNMRKERGVAYSDFLVLQDLVQSLQHKGEASGRPKPAENAAVRVRTKIYL